MRASDGWRYYLCPERAAPLDIDVCELMMRLAKFLLTDQRVVICLIIWDLWLDRRNVLLFSVSAAIDT